MGPPWCPLGLSRASLWLSWGTLGCLLALLRLLWAALGQLSGGSWPLLGLLLWVPGARKLEDRNKVPQDRLKRHPGSQKGPPKKLHFLVIFKLHFWTLSGTPCWKFSGSLAPQTLRFRLGRTSKTLLPLGCAKERKTEETVAKMTPKSDPKSHKNGDQKWVPKMIPPSAGKGEGATKGKGPACTLGIFQAIYLYVYIWQHPPP